MTTSMQGREITAGRWARPLTVLVAALAPAAVWLAVVGVGGVDVDVPESFGSETEVDLELGAVIGASLIACLLGWALLALLERVVPSRALTIWTVTALVVLALSMPWSAGFSPTDRVVITVMHLCLGAVLVLGLRRTSTPAD